MLKLEELGRDMTAFPYLHQSDKPRGIHQLWPEWNFNLDVVSCPANRHFFVVLIFKQNDRFPTQVLLVKVM